MNSRFTFWRVGWHDIIGHPVGSVEAPPTMNSESLTLTLWTLCVPVSHIWSTHDEIYGDAHELFVNGALAFGKIRLHTDPSLRPGHIYELVVISDGTRKGEFIDPTKEFVVMLVVEFNGYYERVGITTIPEATFLDPRAQPQEKWISLR
jgi:hypothetical protein